MTRQERTLAILLRLFSIPLLFALPCAMLPVPWMDAVHRWLGLGPLPGGPIVDFLARSCSLFYAMHGATILFLSLDVRRFLPVIRFFAWSGIAFGLGMLAVDQVARLPAYWTWMEGPVIVGEGSIMLWLVRRASQTSPAGQVPNPAQKP